jgi:hypothetical protein
MKNIYTLLLILFFLFSCTQKTKQSDKDKFIGLWKLVVLEKQDPQSGNWDKYKDGLQGYILYDGIDHMAVHLTTRGYESTDLRFPNFTDTIPIEALRHLTNSYVYFAKYTIDEENKTVEHARISHSNPGLWNEMVYRKYAFSGDTLILHTTDDQPVPLRVKWIRP